MPPAPRAAPTSIRSLPALGLALGLMLAPFAAAAAPTAGVESFPVPDPATITLDGLGFGHGVGLSQYGARDRANDGQGYSAILRFYYPHTARARSGGKVRVLITADTSRDVVVAPRPGLTVRSLAAGRSWRLTPRVAKQPIKRWRIMPGPGTRSTVSFRTKGWHAWRVVRGDAEFSAGGAPVRLFTPAGAVEYRGVLRSASKSGSTTDRDTVNLLPLDAYLKGVVPREVPAQWPGQAVRAQAVAARTYAAYERAHAPGSRHYQICDTAHCQVYGGYTAEQPESNTAVRDTAGQILTYGGEPAFAQFSASNGGYSVAGAFPYLPAQPDPFDHYDPDGNGVDGWQTTVTDADIEQAYKLEDLVAISIDARDGKGAWGGRVQSITLTSSTGFRATVTGERFRSKLGLRSTLFTIAQVEQG